MPSQTIQQIFRAAVQQHQAGRLDEAERLYQQVLARQPTYAAALHYSGVITLQRGDFNGAVDLIRRALALNPRDADAYFNLGNALVSGKDFDAAITAFRKAVAINPKFAEAHSNLGLALKDSGRFDEAIGPCRQAVALRPDLPGSHKNLGNALREAGGPDEAVAAFEKAIELDPKFSEAHRDLGNALLDRGEYDKAIAAYRRAISLRPDDALAHNNLGLVLLTRGEFEEGWAEHEWRWKCDTFRSPRRDFTQPLWDGSSLEDRTILLHPEQGFGDAIQFMRYAPLVASRGGKLVIECFPQLERLFKRMDDRWQIVRWGELLPAFDVHCPLLSLPRIFGTTLSTIPRDVPYLQADESDAEKWADRLSKNSSVLNVGLAWAGNPTHLNDRYRSIKLERLAPLGGVKAVRFVSLQLGHGAAEAQTPPAGMEMIDPTTLLGDFADTAGLISQLDLVIAVDTSVVHLAGAMGKPVWIMLPFVPDWRWLLDRTDSPWYPTMRLFRQRRRGDWESVISEVAAALKELRAG